MKKIFLILMFAAVVLPLSAQKYGFYGNGKAVGRSYHNGTNGTYIGYHPAGISHSRNSYGIFGTDDSRRSGRSIAPQVDREATGNSSWGIQTPQGTRRTIEIHAPSGEHRHYTSNDNVTRADLGLSTEVMDVHRYSGGGGGSSSGVSYGKTGNGSVVNDVLSFVGLSSTAEVPQLATTTNDGEGSTPTYQGFMSPSDENAPLGDALLPLLLLLIPVIILKRLR